jgi:hypothetical protein
MPRARLSYVFILLVALVASSAACAQTTKQKVRTVEPEVTTVDSQKLRVVDSGTTSERVVIEPQESFASPFAPVKILIDYRKERIQVEPDPATIYVDPEDERKPTQVLWQIECIAEQHYSATDRERGNTSDCLYAKDSLVIRPKKGCSTELFGKEIVIRPGTNAVSSGLPERRIAAELFKKDAASERLCDGSSKKEKEAMMGMPLGTGNDSSWMYELVVMRDGKELIVLDPSLWIEGEGGG